MTKKSYNTSLQHRALQYPCSYSFFQNVRKVFAKRVILCTYFEGTEALVAVIFFLCLANLSKWRCW